ncbi:MAG: hypothetical protein IT564_04530 [Rhodospirillales bacterium]|nr:hypothetical protein [Rhodospirillales bacterium]
MMSSSLFVAVFAIVCAGLGWPIVVRCDRAGALTVVERAAAAFAVGTLAIYFAVFAAGPFWLDKISMGLVSFSAVLLAVPGLRAIPWRGFWGSVHAAWAESRRDPVTAIVWLTLLGIGASSFLQGLAPPNDYDSLMYHLAIPRLDVERGRIAPAWEYGMFNAFLPAGMHHLYRLALVFADGGAAQSIHGLFGLVAAAATAALARRMGAGPRTALLAAVMFLAVRAVIWEMGTAEVDVASAAWFALALLVYLAWRFHPGQGLLVLLGLLVGGGLAAKYHGGVAALGFGALLLVDLARGRIGIWHAGLVPLTALAVFAPHLALSYHLTGNPVFPLFHPSIVPGGASIVEHVRFEYGTGRGLFDLLTTPVSMSLLPMHFYDGMVLGAPYLIALAPLAVLARRYTALAAPVLLATTVFYGIWFYGLGHQVRFLMSAFPVFAALAAIGADALWRTTRPFLWGRVIYICLIGALTFNQLMFVSAYAALRLPAALGLQSADAYHRTPTMNGAFYAPCIYIRSHLQPGERYLSMIGPHSYYCPQASAQLNFWPGEEREWLRAERKLRAVTLAEFVEFFEKNGFRFVIVTLVTENRRNVTGEQVRMEASLDSLRFGPFIAPAIRKLTPLSRDAFAAVYNGGDVLAELKKMVGR